MTCNTVSIWYVVAGAGGSTEVVNVFLTGLALVATVNDLRQCGHLVCRSRCRRLNRSGQRVLYRFRACSDSKRLVTLLVVCCRRGKVQCFYTQLITQTLHSPTAADMVFGGAGGSTEVVRVFFTGFALVATVNDLRHCVHLVYIYLS